MKKLTREDLKLGEYYVISRTDGSHNWITKHAGGRNGFALCFYDDSKHSYISKDVSFGEKYTNFGITFTARIATEFEIAWLKQSELQGKKIEKSQVVLNCEEYEIY